MRKSKVVAAQHDSPLSFALADDGPGPIAAELQFAAAPTYDQRRQRSVTDTPSPGTATLYTSTAQGCETAVHSELNGTAAATVAESPQTDDLAEESPLLTAEEIARCSPAGVRAELAKVVSQLKKKDKRILELQHTVRGLAKHVADASEFIVQREEMEQRVRSMQEAHAEELIEYQQKAQQARLDMLEDRVHLRSVEADTKRHHDEAVLARAGELLSSRTRQIHDENFTLTQNTVLLTNELESGRAKTTELEKQNTSLRHQCDLVESAKAELLARGVAQKREIASLRAQIKNAEDSFERTTEEYEKRLALAEATHAKKLAAVTEERDNARGDAKRLHTELQKLRGASAKLLQQRGDLESFFFAALSDVRAEVLQEKRRLMLQDAPFATGQLANHTASSALRLEARQYQSPLRLTDQKGSGSLSLRTRRLWGTDSKGLPILLDDAKVSGKALPPITGASASEYAETGNTNALQVSGSVSPAALQDAVDPMMSTAAASVPDAITWKDLQSVEIKDLGWSDKERVIQLLFKRIRQQQQQQQHARVSRQATLRTESDAYAAAAVHTLTHTPRPPDEMAASDDEVFLTQ